MRVVRHACVLAMCGGLVLTASAEQTSDTSPPYNNATARLDFRIDIGKYMYLRVGSAGTSLSTVAFTLNPTIPPASLAPTSGNNQAVSWNSVAPTFGVSASGAALPVEVGSNAGTVSLKAQVLQALSNGTVTLPMSDVAISSSNAGLPPPPVPASGTGLTVTVTPTGFTNKVTQQTATWTFSYSPTTALTAGTYTGQLGFTATSP